MAIVALIERLLERRDSIENPKFSIAKAADRLLDAIGATASATGKRVTPHSAMQSPAVFACVRVIAETVGSLPLPVYERLEPRGKRRATAHRLYPLLHDRPNPEMTSMQFVETLTAHAVTWGNGYAEIERTNGGEAIALWPLLPDRTGALRRDGVKFYATVTPDGRTVRLEADEVLHVPGLGFDGLSGYAPVTMAREAIGLALAAEEYGARFFSNGANPGGLLEHPGQLGDDTYRRLRKDWEEMHRGLSNAHRVAILEEGMKWHQLGMPHKDAQFLESRKFSVEEIARLFRVPPHKIQELARSTNNNIEHQAIEFVVDTIRPWVVRWEQAINQTVFARRDRDRFFAEFLIDGLLRGDLQSRYQAYAVGRQWGWLSADDVAELENRNPLPEGQGDIYLVPSNMVPADQAGRLAPAPAIDDDDDDEPDARAHRLMLITRAAAARVVQKEIARVREKGTAHARDGQRFAAWVGEFYADYGRVVAEYLQLEPAAARAYVDRHRAELVEHGLQVLERWEQDAPGELVALALPEPTNRRRGR